MLIVIDYSSENFELPISGNNASNLLPLDISGKIPYLEPEPAPEIIPEPEPEPEIEISRLYTFDEAFGNIVNPNAPNAAPYTFTLYFSPIIGDVKINDIIAVYVNTENRGIGIINDYNGNLFVSINVNTTGNDIITKIKLLHYVTNNKGLLIGMDFSSQNFSLPINGNNASNILPLDYSNKIPYYEFENEPQPEPELSNDIIIYNNMEQALGIPITDSSTPYTLYFYPINGPNVKLNDIIAIYVGNENRTPVATIREFPPDPTKLFAAINVTTFGTINYPETISKIKVFHFINETQGFVTEIDYSTQNFNQLIQGESNSNNPIQLDVP